MGVSDRKSVIETVRAVLAANLSCAEEDWLGEGVSVRLAEERAGRFRFPLRGQSLGVATMGQGAVVACSRERIDWAVEHLGPLARGQLFSAPTVAKMQALVQRDNQFIAGPDQKYVCSAADLTGFRLPHGVKIALYDRSRVERLYVHTAFKHALGFRPDSPRPDRLAVVAECGGQIVGIAGASEDCERMWQIGVDVLPGFQGRGIGRAIVGMLTGAILDEGIVPYYSTEVSNLQSRQLAVSLGYWPAWVELYAR